MGLHPALLSLPPSRRNPLTVMRAALTDTLLPGIWTRDGVRLSGAGTVAGVDDARCSTSTGRLLVPRNTGSYVDLGSQAATMNGLTKMTVLVRHTPQDLSTTRYLIARSDQSAPSTRSWELRLSGSSLTLVSYDGVSAANGYSLGGTFVAGADMIAAFVYDGTNATVANRIQLAASVATAPGQFPATALSNVGGATAQASLAATTAPITIGQVLSGGSGLVSAAAPIGGVAIYIGQALSAAQIDAEIANGYAGAHHRYTFGGTLNDSGTVGGWNGAAVGTGLAYCSDDVRWGPILFGGGGTANPTWDAVNREVLTDGVTQYLRGVGGSLGGITGDAGFVMVGTAPTSSASTKQLASIGTNGVHVLGLAILAAPTLRGFAGGGGNVDTVPVAGTRLFSIRRKNVAGTVTTGFQVGSAAEATASAVLSDTTVDRITFGASTADTPVTPGPINWRGAFAYKGDFAGKQSLAYAWAQSLGATL